MITNSLLQGLAAQTVRLDYAGLGQNPNNPTELVQWQTEAGWAEEIELLVYPHTRVFSSDMSDLPLFGNVEFELQITQGAPGSNKSWSTSHPQPVLLDPSHVTPNAPLFARPNLWIPDHGLRLRFVCTSVRLRALNSTIPLRCELFCSFTPCSGMQSGPVPPIAAFPQYVINPATGLPITRVHPIPKGATEARVIASSGFATVALYQHSGDTIALTAASDWNDWRPLPGGSYYVDVQERADPLTSVLTPTAAEMHFR